MPAASRLQADDANDMWEDQDEEDEEKEKRSRKKASELRIHDLEDDLEMSSDDSEASGEEGEADVASPGQLGPQLKLIQVLCDDSEK